MKSCFYNNFYDVEIFQIIYDEKIFIFILISKPYKNQLTVNWTWL